jgi:hypothetical protein
VLKNGVWHYVISLDVPALHLTISTFGRDEYQICLPDQGCHAIPKILSDAGFAPTETSYVVHVSSCKN